MPKTQRKRARIHAKSEATVRENARVGAIEVLVKTRDLLKRVEELAETLGSVERIDGQLDSIPERGRVRVVGKVDDAAEAFGKDGVALAGGPDGNGSWDYTVLIDKLDETYVLPRSALKFLGWTVPTKDLFPGPGFKVIVDRHGNGSVARRPRKPRR
jgi:hypothetical protein